MIESTPRSRPVIVAAYQMPERYAITMYVSGLTGLIVDWDYQWDSRKSPTIDQNYTGFPRDGVV